MARLPSFRFPDPVGDFLTMHSHLAGGIDAKADLAIAGANNSHCDVVTNGRPCE